MTKSVLDELVAVSQNILLVTMVKPKKNLYRPVMK